MELSPVDVFKALLESWSEDEKKQRETETKEVTEIIRRAIETNKTGPHLFFTPGPSSTISEQKILVGDQYKVDEIVALVQSENLPLVVCLPNLHLLASKSITSDDSVLLLAKNEVYWEEDDFTDGWSFRKWYSSGYGDGSTLSEAMIEPTVLANGERFKVVESTEPQNVITALLGLYFLVYNNTNDKEDAKRKAGIEVRRAFKCSPDKAFVRSPARTEVDGSEVTYACRKVTLRFVKSGLFSFRTLRPDVRRLSERPSEELTDVRQAVIGVLNAKGFIIQSSHTLGREDVSDESNSSANQEQVEETSAAGTVTSSGQSESSSLSEIWGAVDELLVIWILLAKNLDPYKKHAIEFLAQERLLHTVDLANFICAEKTLTGPATKLELLVANKRTAKKEDTCGADINCCRPTYWCASEAVVTRSVLRSLFVYICLAALLIVSGTIGAFSRENSWERAEVATNLVLTGAVAIVLGVVGLEMEGRHKFRDYLSFKRALRQIPNTESDRKQVLSVLKKQPNRQNFVCGNDISWLENDRGWTRVEHAVPLNELTDEAVKIDASGISASIFGKERLLTFNDKTGYLQAGRHVRRPKGLARIHLKNLIQ